MSFRGRTIAVQRDSASTPFQSFEAHINFHPPTYKGLPRKVIFTGRFRPIRRPFIHKGEVFFAVNRFLKYYERSMNSLQNTTRKPRHSPWIWIGVFVLVSAILALDAIPGLLPGLIPANESGAIS